MAMIADDPEGPLQFGRAGIADIRLRGSTGQSRQKAVAHDRRIERLDCPEAAIPFSGSRESRAQDVDGLDCCHP